MKLASIERINAIDPHPNADAIVIASVLGYKAIVKKDQYAVGDVICFIQPDTVLPDRPWAAFYKAKSSRVKAIRLRGVFSQGVIERLETVGYTGPVDLGLEISEAIGVVKYEAPAPQDLNASGSYGFGIPKTDEERFENLLSLPYGEKVDVTLKVDGQSWSAFHILPDDVESNPVAIHVEGVGGRSFLYKLDSDNNYTRNERQYDVLKKLGAFCGAHGVNLCIRGESHGNGIQKKAHNPHCKLPLSLAFYSAWLIDERRYARKGDPYYIFDIAPQMGLPTVPIIEKDVTLTPELVAKYAEGISELNGQPFEGVVINWAGGSFKVINRHYDSKA